LDLDMCLYDASNSLDSRQNLKKNQAERNVATLQGSVHKTANKWLLWCLFLKRWGNTLCENLFARRNKSVHFTPLDEVSQHKVGST